MLELEEEAMLMEVKMFQNWARVISLARRTLALVVVVVWVALELAEEVSEV